MPQIAKMFPRLPQDRPKTLQDRPKTGPGPPQDRSGPPRANQEPHKSCPRAARSCPGATQELPKSRPRAAQSRPRATQDFPTAIPSLFFSILAAFALQLRSNGGSLKLCLLSLYSTGCGGLRKEQPPSFPPSLQLSLPTPFLCASFLSTSLSVDHTPCCGCLGCTCASAWKHTVSEAWCDLQKLHESHSTIPVPRDAHGQQLKRRDLRSFTEQSARSNCCSRWTS